MTSTSDDARRSLHNAIVMAYIDGKIHGEEKKFIQQLCKRLNLDEAQFQAVLADVKADPKRLKISAGSEGQKHLEMLCQAASCDGELSDAERSVLEKVAAYLGLGPEAIDAMLPSQQDDLDVLVAIGHDIETLYAQYHQWDSSRRQEALQAIAAHGRTAVIPLLQIIESYRTPANMDSGVALKTDVAHQLGRLGDDRAVYYLAQQVNLGDSDDEITCLELRVACAQAIAALVEVDFGQDPVAGTRQWWQQKGRTQFNRLAM